MKLSDLNDNQLTKQFNAGHALCLRGSPGIAKTAVIEQYAARNDLGCVVMNLTASDPMDALGFLIPVKTDDGPVAHYSKPNWLTRIEESGEEQGILFLDELLSAEHITVKAFAPLLSEKRIGEWLLPEGWVVWASGNRVQDKSGAMKMLVHAGNRMNVIDVTPDLEAWCQWANDAGVHPMYIAYANARPGEVFNGEPPKDPDGQRLTPRSLVYAQDYHTGGQVEDDLALDLDPVTQSMIAGYIGQASTADLFGFFRTVDELPTIQEIIDNPETAKLPDSMRMDAQYAAVQLCIHHADSETIDPIFQYITRLNKELQASAAKQLIDKTKGSLLNSKALGQWMSENPALITSTFA